MNILFVLHNWPGYLPHGGTELHVHDIARRMAERSSDGRGEPLRAYVLFPAVTPGAPQLVYGLLDVAADSLEHLFLKEPVEWESFVHEEVSALLQRVIEQKRIEIVHIFHLQRQPLALPLVAQWAGARVVYSFFDYHAVCPEFNLLRNAASFCGYPAVTLKDCDRCLHETFQYPYSTQALRRRLVSAMLTVTDAVHYLCEDQRARILSAYPHLTGKPELVQGLGVADRSSRPGLTETSLPPAAGLDVACIGNVTRHKGGDLLLQIADSLRAEGAASVRLHVFGKQMPPYDDALRASVTAGAPLHLRGAYTPDELPALIMGARARVAFFASIWPETFVLALSEAWSLGLVPVAPRLGAFAERIRHGENGFLYEPDDPGSAITLLTELASAPERIDSCLPSIARTTFPTIEENVDAYLALYERIRDTGKETEESQKRSAALAYLASVKLPRVWEARELPMAPMGGEGDDLEAIALLARPSAPRRSLLRRLWGVLRRHGLRHTVGSAIARLKQRFGTH